MNLTAQLEELHLIKCSLLPGEIFSFALPEDEAEHWTKLLDAFAEGSLPANPGPEAEPVSACRFRISVEGAPIAFEFELPRDYPSLDGNIQPLLSIRGTQADQVLEKAEQVRWQELVKDKLAEVQSEFTDFITQMLISEHLIPLLHAEAASQSQPISPTLSDSAATSPSKSRIYHALLTSHHLISPTKRRNLAKWTAELRLRGFAKVGHPGVIYIESSTETSKSGSVRTDTDGWERVEEFVRRVKAMQWLALRVRFVEELQVDDSGGGEGERASLKLREGNVNSKDDIDWLELEKVGEVVEVMRRSGREKYVTEMGLGSAGSSLS